MSEDSTNPQASRASGGDPFEKVAQTKDRLLAELKKVIVGQDEVIEQLMITLLARGHCLLTGIPGLGKTLLVKTLAEAFWGQ